MTYKQFRRWESFATRMAKHCYPKTTDTRKAKILEEVKSFFTERRYQKDYSSFTDWDGNDGSECLTSYVDDFFEKYTHWNRREEFYTGRFYEQVTCCIRAGFDVAVKPSGGVLGFTVGDVRRMWSGLVPDWVKEGWDSPFDAAQDNDAIWL
jgi:hypothetical protein